MSARPRLFGAACLLLSLAGGALGQAHAQPTSASASARLYFLSPLDGEHLKSPVLVRAGLAGMGIAPAGIEFPGTGHHHVIIDAPLPAPGEPIPADAHHVHLGGGQTETSLTLAPGAHTLQLLLGDHLHRPHDPLVASERIRIVVE